MLDFGTIWSTVKVWISSYPLKFINDKREWFQTKTDQEVKRHILIID